MESPTFLAEKNSHDRDSHISFEEGPHIYTIDGDSDYTSVTKWNHSHFPKFDADLVNSELGDEDFINDVQNWKESEKTKKKKVFYKNFEKIKLLVQKLSSKEPVF